MYVSCKRHGPAALSPEKTSLKCNVIPLYVVRAHKKNTDTSPYILNPLTPNDAYGSRNAPLTSKRFILYIYSTNIGIEYFKHDIYSPVLSLQNAVCFIILTYLVPVLFTFYLQHVLKLKENVSGAKRLTSTLCKVGRLIQSCCHSTPANGSQYPFNGITNEPHTHSERFGVREKFLVASEIQIPDCTALSLFTIPIRGADTSLNRPGMKEANVSVRMA